MRRDLPRRAIGAVAAVGLLVAGCEPSDPVPEPSPTAAPDVPGLEQPDVRQEQLRAEVDALADTLAAARSALEQAEQATELAAARSAGERAVHTLTLAPDLAGDLDGDGRTPTLDVVALLPGPRDDIPEDTFYGDQLSSTLTAARDAGVPGGRVIDVLRDPIAGDLGAWQADAASVLDAVRTAADAGDLPAVEQAVDDVPGHAAKALAWALLTVRADDLATATGAAARGTAHLDITLDALRELPAPS